MLNYLFYCFEVYIKFAFICWIFLNICTLSLLRYDKYYTIFAKNKFMCSICILGLNFYFSCLQIFMLYYTSLNLSQLIFFYQTLPFIAFANILSFGFKCDESDLRDIVEIYGKNSGLDFDYLNSAIKDGKDVVLYIRMHDPWFIFNVEESIQALINRQMIEPILF